ncbi:nucleotidyl transferase AbiEii/AbiGii toxin family protein [uncultured Rikenella sp.]|uniref:nucleotidyl transferase AbiEii/AbiGii toxin family protein n=1 Tax=uncultured Rikenella sp. TaxID=368003 RepID=UPI003421B93F
MHDPELANFNLAGGTALALYVGHRKSIDLDLFTAGSSLDANNFLGRPAQKHTEGEKEHTEIITDFPGRETELSRSMTLF